MKKSLVLFALLIGSLSAKAQLFIDTSYTVQDMVNGFFGLSGSTISNINYTGAPVSLAFFEGSQSNIGLNAGLVITTGEAPTAVGPNNNEGAGTIGMGTSGTPWLNALIPGFTTYDASIITMDIVPSTDTLSFRYVFGSEEYLEFVNSSYNDLFAFFIEGPGFPQGDTIQVPADTVYYNYGCYTCVDTFLILTDSLCLWDSTAQFPICYGPGDTLTTYCYYEDSPNCPIDTIIYPAYSYYSPGGTNLALIPNTNLPVAINNLNQFLNTQYFYNNAGGTTVQYDAFTTPLWAKTAVIPGETYHVRIAIADAGDAIFDSGVFLSIESIGGDSLLPVDVSFESVVQPGTKKVKFDNNTFWATEWHWDFGDGFISEERTPEHTYSTDGQYTVSMTANNWCSKETFTQTVLVGVSGTNDIAENVFRIAPNPTNGSFVLTLQQGGEAKVKISSMDGRLMLEQDAVSGSRIQLDRFEKGIYNVQVITNGNTYTQKLVKQ